MNRAEDARRVLDALPAESRATEDAVKLRAALDARCEETPEARAAVEKIVELEPRNAAALACLGALLRTNEPQRALDFYRRASEVEPRNPDYATGVAAALIQLRQFEQAAGILERVIRVAPDHYTAHTNLASALYGMRLYKRAIEEYKWVSRARPELAVVHFLLGSSHDHLGEYPEALAAYETFLVHADAQTNQLEIDKVNLRLPSLRRQIARGEGVKKDKKNSGKNR
jgi:tetratricopeptide (TPR) repeat protein